MAESPIIEAGNPISAVETARRLAAGETTSEALVSAHLAAIEAREPQLGAWAFLDRDHALAQARRADAIRQTGHDLGPLHGVPLGVKDIFDTADMPTENGTVLDQGRQPGADCAAVAQLRQAGAIILGKTVSTELAVYAPSKTVNPHDPDRTPGGSSSGSAAAVAAGMVPLALGSQTNASIIRPASFCGVVGYKPSHGLISRHGVLAQSRLLDHVGVLARSVEDAAFLAECLLAYDARDPDMRPSAKPRLLRAARVEPPVTPMLALCQTPVWDRAEADLRHGFAELQEELGEGCDAITLPEPFAQAYDDHRRIHVADIAQSFDPYYRRGKERLSDQLCGMIEEGQAIRALDYKRAFERREVLYAGLAEVFERYDAIITPAACGQAPKGLKSTGDPIFATLWTLLGVPAITLPLLQGNDGLPIGVQLVGPRGDDARLLRSAAWLAGSLLGQGEGDD